MIWDREQREIGLTSAKALRQKHQALFPVDRLSASGGQSIGASASGFPMNNSGLISFRID